MELASFVEAVLAQSDRAVGEWGVLLGEIPEAVFLLTAIVLVWGSHVLSMVGSKKRPPHMIKRTEFGLDSGETRKLVRKPCMKFRNPFLSKSSSTIHRCGSEKLNPAFLRAHKTLKLRIYNVIKKLTVSLR
jgi:hypothetical protein